MYFLNLKNISFSYQNSIKQLFNSINHSFINGWTAVIGPNGCGKSTLLKLIEKSISPSSGTINPNLTTYLCKQDNIEELPKLFYDPDIINSPQTHALLSKLEIKEDWGFKWDNLSGGEKKRCMVANAICTNSQVLLIDEMANHLDKYSMNLLANELREYKGIGIIISHDIDFLDSICQTTLILEPTKESTQLFYFNTKPSIALKEKDLFLNDLINKKTENIKELNKLKKYRDVEKNNVQTSKKRLSKKNINPKDHSTAAKIDGARITGKDKKAGDKISTINSKIERKTKEVESIASIKKHEIRIEIPSIKYHKSNIFSLNENSIKLYNNYLIINHPYLNIENNDRIIIEGNNGVGKSSFIKYIIDYLKEKEIPHYYIAQEYTIKERIQIKQSVLNLDKEHQSIVISNAFLLGVNPDDIFNNEILSPGENQKLLYSLAFLNKTPLLILDEPTNYLDIVSIKALIEAIEKYNGAIIAASHDKYFCTAIAKKIWNIEKTETVSNLSEKIINSF